MRTALLYLPLALALPAYKHRALHPFEPLELLEPLACGPEKQGEDPWSICRSTHSVCAHCEFCPQAPQVAPACMHALSAIGSDGTTCGFKINKLRLKKNRTAEEAHTKIARDYPECQACQDPRTPRAWLHKEFLANAAGAVAVAAPAIAPVTGMPAPVADPAFAVAPPGMQAAPVAQAVADQINAAEAAPAFQPGQMAQEAPAAQAAPFIVPAEAVPALAVQQQAAPVMDAPQAQVAPTPATDTAVAVAEPSWAGYGEATIAAPAGATRLLSAQEVLNFNPDGQASAQASPDVPMGFGFAAQGPIHDPMAIARSQPLLDEPCSYCAYCTSVTLVHPTCQEVLSLDANGHSCAARMTWLKLKKGMTTRQAANQVAADYPVCGSCDKAGFAQEQASDKFNTYSYEAPALAATPVFEAPTEAPMDLGGLMQEAVAAPAAFEVPAAAGFEVPAAQQDARQMDEAPAWSSPPNAEMGGEQQAVGSMGGDMGMGEFNAGATFATPAEEAQKVNGHSERSKPANYPRWKWRKEHDNPLPPRLSSSAAGSLDPSAPATAAMASFAPVAPSVTESAAAANLNAQPAPAASPMKVSKEKWDEWEAEDGATPAAAATVPFQRRRHKHA